MWPRGGRPAPTGTSAMPTTNSPVGMVSPPINSHQRTLPRVALDHSCCGTSPTRVMTGLARALGTDPPFASLAFIGATLGATTLRAWTSTALGCW